MIANLNKFHCFVFHFSFLHQISFFLLLSSHLQPSSLFLYLSLFSFISFLSLFSGVAVRSHGSITAFAFCWCSAIVTRSLPSLLVLCSARPYIRGVALRFHS
ncbi:hypothetical protein ACOSQ2_020450 [Xanthoceras sorbifolium]